MEHTNVQSGVGRFWSQYHQYHSRHRSQGTISSQALWRKRVLQPSQRRQEQEPDRRRMPMSAHGGREPAADAAGEPSRSHKPMSTHGGREPAADAAWEPATVRQSHIHQGALAAVRKAYPKGNLETQAQGQEDVAEQGECGLLGRAAGLPQGVAAWG